MVTAAPSAARRRATAAPMPRLPPVISARVLAKRSMTAILYPSARPFQGDQAFPDSQPIPAQPAVAGRARRGASRRTRPVLGERAAGQGTETGTPVSA